MYGNSVRAFLLASLVIPVVAGCGSSSTVEVVPTGRNVEISITNFVFSVPEGVMQGDLVQLKNNDDAAHNLMPLDDSFSVDVAAGQTVDLPLLAAGTYEFHCHIHPDMMGTLTIN
jgi:plastocyanin